MKRPLTPIQTLPFRGGCNTAIEAVMVPSGGFSMIQNLRNRYPAFEKRKGQAKLHTTADSTNKVLSLYQFSKAKVSEHHLFAQMSDDDVLEATNNPPTVTTGAFGSQVFAGSGSSIPASWSNLNDKLLFSNGVDQHQIYPGTLTPVQKFLVYKGAATIPTIPILGEDYSNEVTDGLSTTVAPLDSLSVLTDYDCLFICSHVQAKQFTFTVTAANGTAAVMQGKYWKTDSSWAALTITDNTIAVAGKTLGQTGSMTWTPPADEMPRYMFGAVGYWYQFSLASGALDSEVEVSEVTYEANWQNIVNLWDGVPLDIVEFQFYDASADVYKTFGASSIEIDSAVGASDIFYFSSGLDLIEGFYVDVGKKPNTTASTTINAVLYWDGDSWVSVGTFADGTNGLSQSGWVTFPRPNAAHEQQFAGTEYYAYWWKFTVDQTLNDDVIIAMSYMPYFNISELGKGYSSAAWKTRMCYSFDRWGQYIYVAAADSPMVLNGTDYGILEAGDGRSNKIVAMRPFHNEIMVWQKEIGTRGGCLTLFEGYSPTTFGKLILSSRLGAMNSKSVAVIDGVLTSTATEEKVKTLAFALSRYGVYVTDGRTCSFISDEIRDRFDPTNTTNCIRAGYESEMWLEHDATYNVIRIGLVCGASATVPNIFPVFDLKDKTWSFDALGQSLSCMAEVEAASGAIGVLQVGGGTADGTVYLLNSGTDDVSTAIDSYATMELDAKGEKFNLREMVLRMKAQSAGNCTIMPSINGVAQSSMTAAMTAENSNESFRRQRIPVNLTGYHLSLKFENGTAAQSIYLEDIGLRTFAYGEQ